LLFLKYTSSRLWGAVFCLPVKHAFAQACIVYSRFIHPNSIMNKNVLLVALLSVAAITACGKKEEAPAPAPAPAAEAAPAAPAVAPAPAADAAAPAAAPAVDAAAAPAAPAAEQKPEEKKQ